jgi:transposase
MTRQGGRKSFIFMQDNAPVHTAKKINDFLERNGYDVLDDPAQSLDLSSLENIWWAIEKALLDKPLPSNGDALFFLNKFQIHLRERSISSTGSTH